jgi:NAD(P)-dependent dehydrogenase (short-subunit alcohol dehydrogenase family)
VVTGASSGIGEAIARELARTGWHCVLLARGDRALERDRGEIGGEWEACDVSERGQVDAVAARVLERHPSIGLLVNNAGVPAAGSFLDVDPDVIERAIRINYLGGVWCLRGVRTGAPLREPTSSTSSPSRAPSRSRRPAPTPRRSTRSLRSHAP